MALGTPSLLDTASSTTSSTTVTSGSVSPTAGNLLVVVVGAIGNSAVDAVNSVTTTCSGSWTLTEKIDYSAANGTPVARVAIYTATVPASPGSGTFTATFAGAEARKTIAVIEISGHDTSSPIGATATGSDTGTTLSITLDASPAADSCVIGATVEYDNTANTSIEPGSGFNELADFGVGASPDAQTQVEYDSTPLGTTVNWSGYGSSSSIQVGGAIEIKAAADAGLTIVLDTA